MRDIHDHRRINDIILGTLERRATTWLIARMPAWVSPDLCTFAALIGAAVAAAAYALSNLDDGFLWLASAGVVVHWLGDSVDGGLARARRRNRPRYGFYVDHAADSVSQALMIGGLGLSPFVDLTVSLAALAGLQMLTTLVFLRTFVLGEFRLSFGRIGPTEGRVVIILLNAAMFFLGPGHAVVYHVVVLFFGALALWHFGLLAVRDLAALRRDETAE